MEAKMEGAPVQQGMVLGDDAPYLQCLARQQKVEVREKANVIEAVTAMLGQEIEMANKYKVFADGGEQELLYAVETTDCFMRQAKQCCPDCAPWKVDVLYTENGAQVPAFQMRRDCTATCLCFNRPVVNILDTATGEKLGSIKDPFACCDLTFAVMDPADDVALKANGGCCQWGLCCPLPCGPCSEVSFPITDAKTDASVGQLQKKVPGCCKFLLAPDVDNYKLDFGGVQNPRYKALLLALAVFVDFRYFSDNKNDEGRV